MKNALEEKIEVYNAFLKITKIFDKLGPEKTFRAFPTMIPFIEQQVGNNLSLLELMYAEIYTQIAKDLEPENRIREVNNLPLKSADDVISNLKLEPV